MKKTLFIGMASFLLIILSGCKTNQNTVAPVNQSKLNSKTDNSTVSYNGFICVEPSKEIIPNGYILKSTEALRDRICHYHYEGNGILNISFVGKNYEERLTKERAYNPKEYKIIKEFEYLNKPGHVLGYDYFEKGKYEEKWAEYKYKDGYLVAHSKNIDAESLVEILKKYSDLLNTKN